MAVEPSLHMWLTFAIIGVAIISFVWEKVSLEITSLSVVVALLVTFQIFPLMGPEGQELLSGRNLLAGFADPALLAILALLVIGQALVQTGALDMFARMMVNAGAKNPRAILILTLVFVLLLSAILNNTPVVVIFIPILSALASKLSKSLSHVMIPLSFVAILGGNLTLFGSSTNLLVSGELEGLTGAGLSFFDFIIPGSVMAFVGFLYLIFFAPFFLKDRASMEGDMTESPRGKQFIVQLGVEHGSKLEGYKSIAGMFPDLPNLTIRMIQRGEEALLPPFDDITLRSGDILIIAATREVLTENLKKSPDIFKGTVIENIEGEEESRSKTEQQMLAETVVAPVSSFDGRTLKQIGFFAKTNCIVLGIQRRSRMIRGSIDDIRLTAGDVLLVMGTRANVMGLRTFRDVLLLEWSATDLPKSTHALRALGVFAGVVTMAATGLLPITISALLGAVILVGMDCISISHAARAVDRRIVLMVGAALAMGISLNATNGAEYIAQSMITALSGASPAVILSAFFLMIAALTNVLSNNATAVLFTPIALSISHSLNVDPMPFIVAVIFASNCSFATPMGYQTNLLVMGPGHYKFADFMKTGIPLIIILWSTFTIFAPWYYGL